MTEYQAITSIGFRVSGMEDPVPLFSLPCKFASASNNIRTGLQPMGKVGWGFGMLELKLGATSWLNTQTSRAPELLHGVNTFYKGGGKAHRSIKP